VVHISRRRPLSNYCNNLGNGGSGVRVLQDVQALKIVVSVSFSNFC
jgi:hypothetical protein